MLYLLLHLLAGICFGLAAANRWTKVNPLALGLLFWVLAHVVREF